MSQCFLLLATEDSQAPPKFSKTIPPRASPLCKERLVAEISATHCRRTLVSLLLVSPKRSACLLDGLFCIASPYKKKKQTKAFPPSPRMTSLRFPCICRAILVSKQLISVKVLGWFDSCRGKVLIISQTSRQHPKTTTTLPLGYKDGPIPFDRQPSTPPPNTIVVV